MECSQCRHGNIWITADVWETVQPLSHSNLSQDPDGITKLTINWTYVEKNENFIA